MIYRVVAQGFFEVEDEGRDAMHDVMMWFPKGINVNVGTKFEERCFAELQICQHDGDAEQVCARMERHEKED